MLNDLKLYFYLKINAMEINWIIIGIVVAVAIVLVVLTTKKNQKEKKNLTDLLNNDFKKPDEDEPDFDNNNANEQ
jgi:FtsZ-interacting cell division protein ZipA